MDQWIQIKLGSMDSNQGSMDSNQASDVYLAKKMFSGPHFALQATLSASDLLQKDIVQFLGEAYLSKLE